MNQLVDVKKGMEACGGYPDVFDSVLEVFMEEVKKLAPEIRMLYEHKDWKDFNVRVHGIKNSAATVGALKLSDYSKELEEASSRRNIETIDNQIDGYLLLMVETIEWFQGYLKENE